MHFYASPKKRCVLRTFSRSTTFQRARLQTSVTLRNATLGQMGQSHAACWYFPVSRKYHAQQLRIVACRWKIAFNLEWLRMSGPCVYKDNKTEVLYTSVICQLDVSNRFSKPKHVFYGGLVVGESAMNFVEDIGPEVIHGYEVCHTRLLLKFVPFNTHWYTVFFPLVGSGHLAASS